ncbi:hypothetical protein A1O3_08711 [Capronia epimyces CBS 606.96]|uniref:Uncharacterized protein n=1 Tax=Capronia epimyces CBS 606.96 TaxID=1182542 RepID=W9XPE3_9EURO|nr:uncharacterized protein A1O3_08711 [Capronia epimyces CBS 606.96]EXJ79210.1 hypothetical protein A1O3_08711 [Capronia epimyces CBS 606.96]
MSWIAETAAALTRIYVLFVELDYVRASDLRMAPHSAQELDVDRCRHLGLSEAAIVFLKQIPWAAAGSGDLIKNSEMIDFSEAYSLAAAQRPTITGNSVLVEHGARTRLDPSMLSLTFCGDQGHALVVDTVRGSIRKWDGTGDVMASQEYPARSFLDDIYASYLSLAEIPYELEILQPTIDPVYSVPAADGSPRWVVNTKYVLVKAAATEHGWPHNFSKADFKRKAARYLYVMEGDDDDHGSLDEQ